MHGHLDGPVGEPGGLDELDAPRRTPGTRGDQAEHHPAARGPQVDGGERCRPLPAGLRAHRRNAAATPASTGTCSPAVRQPTHALRESAAELLLRGPDATPEQVVFQPELVVRTSSGGPVGGPAQRGEGAS
ncbi:hypothetical protein DNL40_10960 [Xylanimonas oleitrophica]|uniref:LacI family transcriptional regulator n=1 Tax=Xylanimonas oleitrophica TaxID=2607479 RepID=A0A2W5WWF3_9MICO|nr:hypothetical protein DNL40_10960 [Xylanimonas oleitrophica]